ncbi:GGDEF domain-containing protein [Crossiella sp. CA-258035]|uniref:GGDEF domain-containing protein n=1 Tax=Crossiella sp. CA-258035 TaxID=2981138 RepID=UPI0024BBFC45|nr:GGDEF domain-containing protein [Crossiella sp. CA-258035]WHT21749.1 GGDEF domain-containing protein [Crossiella sp. CA-258035]
MAARTFRVLTTTALAGLALLVVVTSSGMLSWWASMITDKAFQLVAALFAVFGYAWTARGRTGVGRRWRWWMAAASVGLAFGLGALTVGSVFGMSRTIAILASVAFVVAPLLSMAGMVEFARGEHSEVAAPVMKRRYGGAMLLVDALIILGSLSFLVWVASAIPSGAPRSWFNGGAGMITLLIHPAAYVVLLGVVATLSRVRLPARQLPVVFLSISFACQSASGWLFAYLISKGTGHVPPIADIGFMAGTLVFALAPWAPVEQKPGGRESVRLQAGDYLHLVVPYVPLVITGVFIAIGTALGIQLGIWQVYLGLFCVGLIMIRQLLTSADNMRLLKRLQDSQRQLEYQAYHDSLTGLANRVVFRDRLAKAINSRIEEHRPLMLLFIDVDDFKAVNDRFGHAAGDAVLRAVGERLRGCVVATDTVARLGGDEFGVLLDGTEYPPEEVGERVLAALQVPYAIAGQQHVARASIGVVCLTVFEHDLTADKLLGLADAAMYTAKRRGKARLIVHGTGVEVTAEGQDQSRPLGVSR